MPQPHPHPHPQPQSLTPTLIAAHERLYPRLSSLLKQVERVASRVPRAPVPPETAQFARELVGRAAKLLGREGRGIAVPHATPSAPLEHAALAVALGQAVAGLEAFEGAHAMLSLRHRAICWLLPGGKLQPVARRLPATPPKDAPAWGEAEYKLSEHDHKKLVARLLERENVRYMQGYRDGRAGRKPHPPFRQMGPVD